MSLETPEKIRNLPKKLHLQATPARGAGKARVPRQKTGLPVTHDPSPRGVRKHQEPRFRFYQLGDKVWRSDILEHAYRLAKANDGAAGVDGVTLQQIESEGRQEWLRSLQEELRSKSYRPQPVRRVKIPKPGGGPRPLGIPTVRDRVAQTAVKPPRGARAMW